jgi:hypothetical protein
MAGSDSDDQTDRTNHTASEPAEQSVDAGNQKYML